MDAINQVQVGQRSVKRAVERTNGGAAKQEAIADRVTVGSGTPLPAPSSRAASKAAGATAVATEGATEIPGMFKVLRKDDKVWLSMTADQLNKPFFFSSNVAKSIGEKGLTGSEMGRSQLAEFRKVGSQVQLVAKNSRFFAEENTPQANFVAEDFADSLLASAPLVAGANKNEILVEANALLFTDIPGYQARLANNYKTAFTLDAKNSSITDVDNSAEQTSMGVQVHYQAPNILAPGGSLPTSTPEARSVLAEFRYSFLKLPDQVMTPRLADDRVGHFATTRVDYTTDDGDGKVRYVNRWRLEKKDPDAAMSEPVKPVTYWMNKNIPEKYRETVKGAILEWNKAFEKIGIKNAIEVRQQTEKDDFDTNDAGHASISWYTATDVGAAVGPSHVDPRSGEILDADIRMADIFGRTSKNRYLNELVPAAQKPEGMHTHETHTHGPDGHCIYQELSAENSQFAADLLELRGDSAAAEEFAKVTIRNTVMHEVGHTLGLRHNFKGSTAFTEEQLQDPEFTRQNGVSSSIMDYVATNVAGPGQKQGEYIGSTIGPYDYLAIQYAYQPLEPTREKEALASIAVQTTKDPVLAFETDEAADAMDPNVVRFDLGKDTLGFAEKEVGLGHEMLTRAQNLVLPEGEGYQQLTRGFNGAITKISHGVLLAGRHVGGVHIYRDRAGTDRATFEPVAVEQQREALQFITDTMFKPDSLKLKPEFVSRLAKNRFDTWGDQNVHAGTIVLNQKVKALENLLNKDVAQRIIEAPEKLGEDADTLSLGEVYQTIQDNVWSELSSSQPISQSRRDLQRQHLKLMTTILKPESGFPGDAVSLMRYQAVELQKHIEESDSEKMPLEARAHLDMCLQTLKTALT